MTNKEAKVFLDNLKICIDEHPVVADWLVEIADRKTEPTCDDCIWNVCNYNKVPWDEGDEPQTMLNDGTLVINVEDATKVGRVLVGDDKNRGDLYYPDDEDEPQTCSFSDCDNFKNPDYARCIECKRKQIKSKDEPQTMIYPQVDGITPSVIETQTERSER